MPEVELVRAGPWQCLWHALTWPLRLRPATAVEAHLLSKVRRLEADLDAQRAFRESLETEVRFMKSENELAKLELVNLLAITSRDRARVKAEEAEYAARVNNLVEQGKR